MRKLINIVMFSVLTIFYFGIDVAKLETVDLNSNEYTYKDGDYFKTELLNNSQVLSLNMKVVDGKIVYLDVDRTTKSDIFKSSSNQNVYYKVEGVNDVLENTYRFLTKLNDKDVTYNPYDFDSRRVKTTDLISGLNTAEIDDLTNVDANLPLKFIDKDYASDTKKLEDFVISNNTINSLIVEPKDGSFTIKSFVTKNDLSPEVAMIKEFLDEIRLDNADKVIDLTKTTERARSIYMPGRYTTVFPSVDENGKVFLYTAKYYVSDLGKIEYFKIDKIINSNGILNYQSTVDKDFSSIMKELEDFYKLNGYFLISEEIILAEKNVLDDILDITKGLDGSYRSIIRTTNYIPGVHYTSVDNMMMVVVVNEDGQIVNMTIDETFKWDTAKVLIDGQAYLIYTYDQATTNNEFDEFDNLIVTTRKRVIYGDGTNFFHTDGSPVTFSDELIDERQTVISVFGNLTKQNSLIYNNITGHDFTNEVNNVLDEFLKNDVISFNIINDGTSDLGEGSNIDFSKYVKLFTTALTEITDSKNIINSYVDDRDEEFQPSITDGRFHSIGTFSSVDEGFFTLTLTTKDNKVESIVFDETYDDFGVLTTKNALKNDFYFISDRDLENGIRTNFLSYYEVVKELSNTIYQKQVFEQIFNKAVADYDFKEKSEPVEVNLVEFTTEVAALDAKLGLNGALVSYFLNFESAIENIINEMLRTKFEKAVDQIDVALKEVEYVLADRDIDDAILDLTGKADINGEDLRLSKIRFESSNPENLRITYDRNDGQIKFNANLSNGSAKGVRVTATYSFDRYPDITREYIFKVVPTNSFMNTLFNQYDYSDLNESSLPVTFDNDTLNIFDGKLRNNQDITNYISAAYADLTGAVEYTYDGSNLEDLIIVPADIDMTSKPEFINVFFDKNKDGKRDSDEVKADYTIEYYDNSRIVSNIPKVYRPGLVKERLVNGTYDFRDGLNDLINVQNFSYQVKFDGANVNGDTVLNNTGETNKTHLVTLVGVVTDSANVEEEVFSLEYNFINLARLPEEIINDILNQNFETFYFIDYDEEGQLVFESLVKLSDHENLTWYFDGEKIVPEDGLLAFDLSEHDFLKNSITTLDLLLVYQDENTTVERNIQIKVVNNTDLNYIDGEFVN